MQLWQITITHDSGREVAASEARKLLSDQLTARERVWTIAGDAGEIHLQFLAESGRRARELVGSVRRGWRAVESGESEIWAMQLSERTIVHI